MMVMVVRVSLFLLLTIAIQTGAFQTEGRVHVFHKSKNLAVKPGMVVVLGAKPLVLRVRCEKSMVSRRAGEPFSVKITMFLREIIIIQNQEHLFVM